MFLTGSRALNYHYPEFPIKDSTDWDIVSDESVTSSKLIDVAPEGLNSLEICQHYAGPEIESPIGTVQVVNPIGLMLFKRSHLHRPIEFAKHIRHYHFLKSRHQPDEQYYLFLRNRIKLTKDKYGDRTPKLNKTKEDFFDDYVTKKYEHDALHYATCYGDRPIYEELKTDDTKVWCSQEKWALLSHEKQVQCIREEAFVIAIERYLIPRPTYPARFALDASISRICTTLTSGWFRDFAIENWPEISDCDTNFYDKFLKWSKNEVC